PPGSRSGGKCPWMASWRDRSGRRGSFAIGSACTKRLFHSRYSQTGVVSACLLLPQLDEVVEHIEQFVDSVCTELANEVRVAGRTLMRELGDQIDTGRCQRKHHPSAVFRVGPAQHQS